MQCWFMKVLFSATHQATVALPGQAGVLAAADMPFNPLKLIILVGWVYLGLYCVQRVEFSLVVPKDKKPLINILTLFFGPIPLLVFLIKDVAKTPILERGNFFEAIKERFWAISETIKTSKLMGGRKKVSLSSRFIRHRA